MSKRDRSAAHHVLHVKLEMKSYTGVNDWCDLRGNDSKGGGGEDFPTPKGATRNLERDWTRAWRDRTRGHGFKLIEGRIRLGY